MKGPTPSTATRLEVLPNTGKSIANDLRSLGIHTPGELVSRILPALREADPRLIAGATEKLSQPKIIPTHPRHLSHPGW